MEIAPAVQRKLAEASGEGEVGEQLGNYSFSWAPSGDVIYFDRAYRGARNIWKMTVDPKKLRATGIDPLTIGPGPDTRVAVSADGRRLAFTAKSQRIRTWLFPFDGTAGKIRGNGEAITSPGTMSVARSYRAMVLRLPISFPTVKATGQLTGMSETKCG